MTEDSYRGEINEPDSQNLYAYCAGNPVNYVDPSGHKSQKFWNIAFKSEKQKYYAFNQNAPQKYAGYNDLYDMMDWTVGDLVTKKVETSYWRLQFWKGKYKKSMQTLSKKLGEIKGLTVGGTKYVRTFSW